MASLLLPDDDPTTPAPLLQLPDERPLSLQPDPRADALGQTYKDITDYMARQHQKGIDEGYWAGGGLLEGGHPTLKAFNSATDAYAQGMQAGTLKTPSFNVYHGSPHLFAPTPKNPLGEFRDSAIGSGEGNQMYGMGHYGAEAESVARGMRDALSPKPSGPAVDAYNVANDAFKAKAAELSKARLAGDPVSDSFLTEIDALRKQMIAAREALPLSGHMYEVKVNADPERFLDWDKPLSGQHPDVIKALKNTPYPPHDMRMPVKDYLAGLETNREMATKSGDPAALASRALHEAGIPGIRYLDQESRAKGEGTRNVVVFNPANMEIIRRYGLAGLMLGGGGLLSPDKQEQ